MVQLQPDRLYGATVAVETTDLTWRRMMDPQSSVVGRAALWNDALVGFAICVIHEATWSAAPVCYLEDLFVDPHARGKGAGRALLDDLVELCRRSGWARLYWHTRADNARARRLYDAYVEADDFVRYRIRF